LTPSSAMFIIMETRTPTIPDPMATWRLTDDFLIEPRPEGDRLWGRWDRQFGLWDADGNTVCPDIAPLGRLGTWFDPDGPRDGDDWYQSRAAIAAYWATVPTRVRLIASQLPQGQWEALRAMWAEGCELPRNRKPR